MLYEEFKVRTNREATFEMYEKYNTLYMAGNLDKDEFCKLYKKAVDAEVKEMHQNDNRLVRILFDRCINGSNLYKVFAEVKPRVLQDTGYIQLGMYAPLSYSYKIRKGIAKLTRAEQKEIDRMECLKTV